MKVTCLHTAQVHVRTFGDLFQDVAGDVQLVHSVRPELLEQARLHGVDAVRADVSVALDAALSGSDAVLCTCSTLGPLLDGREGVVRIDRPAMQAAVAHGPIVAVAICLESTRAATLGLLSAVAEAAGVAVKPRLILCDAAWPLFEAGEADAFAAAVAEQIIAEVNSEMLPDSILLAQASMRQATPLLAGLNCPVLTTPELAVRATLDLARG